MADRTDAFISYSHADQAWLQRIKVHLRPLERDHGIVIWQDTNLRGGQRWRQEIDQALTKAKVAILLVSPDFLASDFIHDNELPPLLEAAEQEGLVILSVIVSACAFRRSPLSEFQAINTPDTPLDSLAPGEVNKTLVKLFTRVDELFAAAGPAATKPVATAASKVTNVALTPALSLSETPSSAAPLALLVKADGQWETVAVTFSQIGGGELSLTLQPTSPLQRAFLTSLTQHNALSSIVYNEQTYLCKLRDLDSFTEGNKMESWKLVASLQTLPTSQDMIYNGISPAAQAQSKANILLLNERLAESNIRSPFGRLMRVAEDYVPPLFALYHTLKRDSERFQQVAPLVAAWYLQMSGIVADILQLTTQLNGNKLTIAFEGQRPTNSYDSPSSISVNGQCEIPDYLPTEALPLRLTKLSSQF